MIERQQDVGAAAGANDERLRALQQVIRQRRGGVVEIGERFEPAVKGGDRAEAPAIAEDAKLRWRLDGVAEAQTGGIAKRDQRAANDLQEAERARFLADDFGPGNQECLSKLLVLREAQGRPRGGNCHIDERGADQICGGSPPPPGADLLPAGKGGGEEAEAANHPERLGREEPEEHGDNAERPQPGTYHVIAVTRAMWFGKAAKASPTQV